MLAYIEISIAMICSKKYKLLVLHTTLKVPSKMHIIGKKTVTHNMQFTLYDQHAKVHLRIDESHAQK